MNIVQRIQLAVKGGREERMLLIRDPNKIVQRGVLQSPRLTDLEMENFAAMTNVSQEVLRTHFEEPRIFMKSYMVAKNLTKNPKSPLDVSLHLLPRLTPTDLKQLAANKNVPETLRSSARNCMRQRNAARPPQFRVSGDPQMNAMTSRWSLASSCQASTCFTSRRDSPGMRRFAFCIPGPSPEFPVRSASASGDLPSRFSRR